MVTFDDYIRAIGSANVDNNSSLPKIVINLFNAAKAKKEPSAASAKAWMSGKRICKVISYFPDGVKDFNVKGVYEYFRKRTNEKIIALRNAFYNIGEGIIKQDGDDDEFCRSLINPFLDFLGFPLIETPLCDGSQQVTLSEQINEDENIFGSVLDFNEEFDYQACKLKQAMTLRLKSLLWRAMKYQMTQIYVFF